MEKLLSRTEVAKILKISLPTLDRLCKSGEIPTLRIGHSVRISESKLAAWLESLAREDTAK